VLFWVCRPCFRGQAYCRDRCRRRQRARQRRRANRRHQDSPEGRLDHCDRQRAYRRRRAGVTDQGSEPSLPSGILSAPAPLARWGTWTEEGRHAPATISGQPRCVVCGRLGSWVVPFGGES